MDFILVLIICFCYLLAIIIFNINLIITIKDKLHIILERIYDLLLIISVISFILLLTI